jgi:hypothetical protein
LIGRVLVLAASARPAPGALAGCLDRVFADVLDGNHAGIGALRKVARLAAHLPPAAASTGPHGS